MMNFRALQNLHSFLQAPNSITASNLILTPALHNVVQHEIAKFGGIQLETHAMASWLYVRGEVVWQTLIVDHTDDPNLEIQELHPWQMVHCCVLCYNHS